MSDFDPNNPSDFENDDLGGLVWNEFDWERYLREQDDVIHRYLGFYELLQGDPGRIDKVAGFMGWPSLSVDGALALDGDDDDDDDDDSDDDIEPYTIHKNYIFVATKAIFLDLTRGWERIADNAARVPQGLAIAFQTSLHRGESDAMLAVHALDFGDFAIAISLFKRALNELNRSLSLLDPKVCNFSAPLAKYREGALMRLFDMREIWLRMMRECRKEIERSGKPDSDDDAS